MWRLFVQKYPDLAEKVTEQRVSDQKRVILATKKITHVRLEQLKAEVATEFKTDSDMTFNQEDLCPESPKNDTATHKLFFDSCILLVETAKLIEVEKGSDNQMTIFLQQEFERAIIEFTGTNLLKRPPIPRQNSNENWLWPHTS
ncbi:unnamed protein product [Parnassius apollo]|uniref:(apollo) hypothetical protein n=1 Tax=Parnassius apollo TaxID=110799 RepID=A0A8S3XPB0_PARAO|nr:unnamed protein product [Parnassius apollo]